MDSGVIHLLVLAGIAVFLILRLRAVLGTREGFEKPRAPVEPEETPARGKRGFEVIDGGPDLDITDHVTEGSDAARALAAMKSAEPSFSVGEFLQGARGAYEMILMAFERGDLAAIKPFISADVHESFSEVVEERKRQGLKIEAKFVGLREVALDDADYDTATSEGEVTVRFVAEITSAVRSASGEILEGSLTEIKRQRDVWTFARKMGSGDPNWQLVATGE
jgi:predicted lipid-binding transport protein (Tim44 family)